MKCLLLISVHRPMWYNRKGFGLRVNKKIMTDFIGFRSNPFEFDVLQQLSREFDEIRHGCFEIVAETSKLLGNE